MPYRRLCFWSITPSPRVFLLLTDCPLTLCLSPFVYVPPSVSGPSLHLLQCFCYASPPVFVLLSLDSLSLSHLLCPTLSISGPSVHLRLRSFCYCLLTLPLCHLLSLTRSASAPAQNDRDLLRAAVVHPLAKTGCCCCFVVLVLCCCCCCCCFCLFVCLFVWSCYLKNRNDYVVDYVLIVR